LPFAVRGAEQDAVRLAFQLDAAVAARFRPILERLSRRRAA
jgi:hypothetical protein